MREREGGIEIIKNPVLDLRAHSAPQIITQNTIVLNLWLSRELSTPIHIYPHTYSSRTILVSLPWIRLWAQILRFLPVNVCILQITSHAPQTGKRFHSTIQKRRTTARRWWWREHYTDSKTTSSSECYQSCPSEYYTRCAGFQCCAG